MLIPLLIYLNSHPIISSNFYIVVIADVCLSSLRQQEILVLVLTVDEDFVHVFLVHDHSAGFVKHENLALRINHVANNESIVLREERVVQETSFFVV